MLPKTIYDAKKIICPLGMEVERIHACENGCILFRGEHANANPKVCKVYKLQFCIPSFILYSCTNFLIINSCNVSFLSNVMFLVFRSKVIPASS